MVRCICIDDKNRPEDFPKPQKWIVEGKQYTIINVKFVELSNTHGVQLNEIDLSDCYPYLFFAHKRFAIFKEDLELMKQLIIDSRTKPDSEIDNFDVNEYIKQIEIIPESV